MSARNGFKGKTVTVVGLGRSGFAAAKFLVSRGARVRATDGSEKKEVLENAAYLRNLGVEVETGKHTDAFVDGSRRVVVSPGVPGSSAPILRAAKRRIPVIGEIELASLYCPCPIVGVTGSNGKTTTCTLIHRILNAAKRPNELCGNVGFSFLDALGNLTPESVAVVELSSFQLEDTRSFRPDVAVVLNLSENHLDRHKTLEAYRLAKERIFANLTRAQRLVLNADDPIVKGMARRAKARTLFFSKKALKDGVFVERGRIIARESEKRTILADLLTLKLSGEHNLENALAAAAAAHVLGIGREAIERAFSGFRTLEHRIEPLGKIGGVRFVNDSKSTTVASTRAAILATPGPIVLVAGGRDKGADFAALEPVIGERVKRIVAYGEAAPKIAGAWKRFRAVTVEGAFERAVRAAFADARPGDAVLLSPMCTSYDQFNSFEQRGEAFKRVFEAIRGELGG